MLRQQLVEKSTEIATLEMRLERMKQHAEHFKDLSVAAEESIKQVSCLFYTQFELMDFVLLDHVS